MTQDFFDDDELNKLRDVTKIYYLVKELLLYSEHLDNQELFIPPVNEIKDSFDHLMRVFSVKFGFNEETQEYINVNLSKTYSHTYRALYDLLDYTAILQRKIIYDKVKDISSETLNAIYPRFHQEIIPDIENLSREIPKIKENKDIWNPNTDDIENYMALINKLKLHINGIDSIMPSLLRYENEKKAKEEEKEKKDAETRKHDHRFNIFTGLVIAFFTVILTLLGEHLLTPK